MESFSIIGKLEGNGDSQILKVLVLQQLLLTKAKTKVAARLIHKISGAKSFYQL